MHHCAVWLNIVKMSPFLTIANNLFITEKVAELIVDKAIIGGEFSDDSTSGKVDIDTWLTDRFFPNVVFIDEKKSKNERLTRIFFYSFIVLLPLPYPISTCTRKLPQTEALFLLARHSQRIYSSITHWRNCRQWRIVDR